MQRLLKVMKFSNSNRAKFCELFCKSGMALPWLSKGGCGSMSASPGLRPHLTMTVQLCQTSSSTISSVSALNYAVMSKYYYYYYYYYYYSALQCPALKVWYGKVLIRKISCLALPLHLSARGAGHPGEKKMYIYGKLTPQYGFDIRKKSYARREGSILVRTPKSVSLLLWCKIVAVHCFVFETRAPWGLKPPPPLAIGWRL